MLDLTFLTRAADKARSRPHLWRQALLPAALVLALLLASIIVGLKPTPLLLLPLALWLGLTLSTRFKNMTVPLLLVTSLVVPFAINTGTGTQVNAAIIGLGGLLGLWLLAFIVKQAPFPAVPATILSPALLLIIVPSLSFLVGQFNWFDFASHAPLVAQLGGLSLFVLSSGGFLYATAHFESIRTIEITVWLFLLLGAGYLIGRIVPALQPFTTRQFANGSTGSLFFTWLAALAFAQLLFNRRLSPAWKAALITLLAMLFYAVLVQTPRWRSGWLPALLSITAIAALYSWRVAGLIGIGGLLAAIPVARALIESDAYSFSTRTEAWILIGEIIKVNPLMGVGPANYYYYTPLFPIRGFSIEFNSHNQYVDLLAQTGIVGLIVYLWLFLAIAYLGWRLRTRATEGFPRAYVYGVLGGIVGTLASGMLGDWVIPFVYNIGFSGFRSSILAWVFLGGLVALDRILSKERPETTNFTNPSAGEQA